MAGGLNVQGDDRLVATLHAAAHDLEDLRPVDERAGSLVASATKRSTPHLTGALAASVDVTVTNALVQVTAGGGVVDYAVPVHKRNPWMAKTAQRTRDDVLRLYTDAAGKIAGHIKGA